MKDEKELRKQLLESFSDCSVPEKCGLIKAEYLERQEKKKKKKRGFLLGIIPLAASAVVVAAVVPFAISGGDNSGGSGSDTQISGETIRVQTMSAHESMGYAVSSGASFLGVETSQTITPVALHRAGLVFNDAGNDAASDEVIKEHISDVNPFMPTAENMVERNSMVSEVYYTEGEEYPYTVYLDNGHSFSYKNTGEYQDDEDTLYKMEGIYKVDENTSYRIVGHKEVEADDESKIESVMKIEIDENDYIYVTSESEVSIEEEETEYTYSFYEDKRSVLEVNLSYEVEVDANNRNDMEIEVTTPNKEAEYTLNRSTDSSRLFIMDYEFEDETTDREYNGVLYVSVSEDGSHYLYNGDSLTEELVFPRY